MPGRRKKAEKTKFKFKSTERFLKPDPKFDNLVVEKLVNQIMRDGKKTVARNIVYTAVEIVGKRVKDVEPLEVLLTAINNVKPRLEVRSRRVGGATYQVPMEVSGRRQQTLAIRTIIGNVRGKKGKPVSMHLADEILDAYNQQGASITWRENTHKMAEANKLFAHFAW